MRICFAVDDGPEIEEAFEFYYGRVSKLAQSESLSDWSKKLNTII